MPSASMLVLAVLNTVSGLLVSVPRCATAKLDVISSTETFPARGGGIFKRRIHRYQSPSSGEVLDPNINPTTIAKEKALSANDNKFKAADAAAARGVLPRGDALDSIIIKLALPAVANFVILPLVGTVDTFFVGQLGSSSALAGLGAANQVFSSVFFVVSFLPSVVTPLVAAASASGDENLLRKRVAEALWVSALVGAFASMALFLVPNLALSVVLPVATIETTKQLATSYLSIRALTLVPAMLSYVGFATFRGLLDVITPLKIALVSQAANVLLDPLFIFTLGLGVKGAALATCAAEIIAAGLYIRLLGLKKIVAWRDKLFWMRPPSFNRLGPLLAGGAGVLSRSIAMNTAFLAVTRATQAIDTGSSTAAAGHQIAMQFWQLGGVVLFALSAVASILVPATLNAPVNSGGGTNAAKRAADRMIGWGIVAGAALAVAQLAALPLLDLFTSVQDVRDAARTPAIIGALLQLMNGAAFVAEGIMQGHAAFTRLAVHAFVASAGLLTSLHFMGHTLVGVWLSFGVFNLIRLIAALHHHLVSGPLAKSKLRTAPL
mmetsp:Transcript_14147/g.21383  ORF Transcript_14147/g.21383 Transcript_14147/m.21383 type:complete len:551 (-) Transcript_14147:2048-3700(-)